MRYLAVSVFLTVAFAPDRPNLKPPPPAPIKDFDQLQGVWAVVAYDTSNGPLDPMSVANYSKLHIKGDKFGWSSPDYGTFKIDPTKNPKTIDYWPGRGNDPAQAWQGIYELSGDTFRDCMAPPGKPRPTEFSTPAGSGHIMMVFKRVP